MARYTEARKASNRKWDASNLDRISIAVPKGTKAILEQFATKNHVSVNRLLNQLIDERLERYGAFR